MAPYFLRPFTSHILLVLALTECQLFVAAQSTCGSLLTYRHYLVQLETAPQCFIDGCTTQTKPSSMADTCPKGEPCSDLWNMIHDQYQQDWCSTCKKNVACRIPGWPVLNATAFCDVAPKKWIFGADGSCCSAGNQSFELAEWVGSMCNDSEWRQPFKYYGGSAKLDWEEYLLPWNWTVRAENTSTVIVPPSECPRTKLSLLAFGAENLFFLIFAIGISVTKLLYLRGREDELPAVKAFHNVLTKFKFWEWPKDIYRKVLGRQRSDENDHDKRAMRQLIFSICFSILMTGLQVGFNFLNAWRINSTPGYQNVPIAQLAILFCCRPRLTWLACALELISPEKLKEIFKFKSQTWLDEAHYALSTISIGTAISEIVLQVISIYFMGLTAHTGQVREFYLVQHLRPYWRGPEALAMYVGALMWVIGCFLIILVWIVIFYYGAKIARGLGAAIKRANKVRKRVKKSMPTGPVTTVFGRRKATQTTPLLQRGDNIYEKVPQDPERIDPRSTRARTNVHAERGDAGERLGPLSSNRFDGDMERISPVPNYGEEPMMERMPLHTEIVRSGSHVYEKIGPVDPSRYTDSSGSHGDLSLRSDTLLGSTAYDETNNYRLFAQSPPAKTVAFLEEEIPLSPQLENSEPPRPTPQQDADHRLKHRVIQLGLVIGLYAFCVQWVFWAGFVYTAGPRFCPPSLASAAVIWIIASVSGLALPSLVQ